MQASSARPKFTSHPLIAEAKRRARRRRFLIAVLTVTLAGIAAGATLVAIAIPSAASAGSGVQCTPAGTYGQQCIDVRGSALQVTSIQTSWSGPFDMLDSGKWRIDLERYDCDPFGPKSECAVAATWHGIARTRQSTDSRDLVRVAQSRKNPYWPTFYSLPHSFLSNLWLCTELAVYVSSTDKWVSNGAGLPRGLRACVSVRE